MSALVHNIKEYLNIIATAFEQGGRHCNFSWSAHGFADCRSVQFPVLWNCRGPEEVVFSLGLHGQTDVAESGLLTAEILPLTLRDLSRSWQKSCRSNFLSHRGSCQLGMRFAKARLWFGHAGIKSVFLLNWGLDKLKKRGTWLRGSKSRLFIPYFSRSSHLRVGFQEIFIEGVTI